MAHIGGVEQIKERARDQWGGVWLSHLAQDLRYGVRMLQKWPVFFPHCRVVAGSWNWFGHGDFLTGECRPARFSPVPNPQELRVVTWSAAAGHMTYWGVSDSSDGRQTGEDFPTRH